MSFKLPSLLKTTLRALWSSLCKFHQWLIIQLRINYVKLKRLFIAADIPAQAEGKLNLHLGCGAVNHEKFINIDGYPFPHVHYVQSIDRLPQFADNTVDLIYASHCLEHFCYEKTLLVLQEWYRVLKKGGVLRLSVPDFDKLVDIYLANNRDSDVILHQIMGGQNNKYNFHYTVLNRISLDKLLLSAGFSEIRLWHPNSDDLTTFDDFSVYQKEVQGKMYEISLNIEAVK